MSYPLKESDNKTTFNETAYKQVQELTKLLYDDAAHADIIIRCCENPDGTHNASAANKIIKALKGTSEEQVVSEIAELSKNNASGVFDERFLDALLDAQSRNVSIGSFHLILKECTDVNGNFDKAIYDKIYELRDARLFEGVIPQILKACKNKNGTFNDEVFRTAFKLQEEGFSSGDIGFLLQAARDFDDNYSAKLLDQIKLKIYSGGWGANNFPAIIKTCIDKNGNLDENVYNILEKLNKSGRMSIDDVVRIAPLFQAFAKNLDKNNINELSISEKRTLLKKLIQFNSALFDEHFNMAKQEIGLTSNLLPLSKEDYCALLPKLVKSIGIDTRPLSKEVETGFYRAMDNLSEPNGVLARTDFNSGHIQVELSYPRSQFIENINLLLKDLTPSERNKATDYFGFELINRSDNTVQMNGYPINVNNGAKMTEISEPATKAIIERMRPLVEKFSNNNNSTVKNNPELAQELNNIVKAFPEFLTTIGRKQHGTHDFTIDIHTLKVLQGVITNSRFQKLPEADRKLLQIATLMHDLTKAEGLKDKLHPQYAAYDTYYILEKMNLTEAEKLKVYQLIKNHDWLERFIQPEQKRMRLPKILHLI